ncbi:MAG: hypothetical protein AB4426_01660 [Xenococcaceae cyanobacterium]
MSYYLSVGAKHLYLDVVLRTQTLIDKCFALPEVCSPDHSFELAWKCYHNPNSKSMANSEQPQAKKSGSLLKWIGIGCGGALLTFVLITVGLFYFVKENLDISTNPQEVEQKAKSIFDYNIPGGARGLLTMNVFGMELVQVIDTNQPPEVLLTVGLISQQFQEDPEQFQKSFSENMEQQFKFTSTSKSRSEKELCGQIVSVFIQEGEMTSPKSPDASPAISYTALVNYDNSGRLVWLLTSGTSASQKATAVFNSLQCK